MMKKLHELRAPNYSTTYFQISDDLFLMERHHEWKRRSIEVDVFGSSWVLFVANLEPGRLCINLQGEKMKLEGPKALLVPPFGVIEWEIEAGLIEGQIFFGTRPLPPDLNNHLLIMDWPSGCSPLNSDELLQRIRMHESNCRRGTNESTLVPAQRAKNFLDQNFRADFKIPEMAEELGLSYSTLTHAFRKAFRLSPVEYRNRLRVFESMKKLFFEQKTISSTAFEVGFQDLSRFNKQFMRQTRCRPSQMKPQTMDESLGS